MRKFKLLLLVLVLVNIAQPVLALGLPQRLYPAKAIKKSIQVLVKKVSRNS
jgi:hypothetical protein